MSEQIFNGVPRALILDSWWMSADAEFETPEVHQDKRDLWGQLARKRIVLLLALLALADALFFRQAVGVSLAVFTGAVFVASALDTNRSAVQRGPVIVLILGILPVIEYVQFFSVLFLILGLLVSVAWQRLGKDQSLEAVLYAARRLALFLPIGSVQSIDAWVRAPSSEVDVSNMFRELVRNWAFPIGGASLILSLLMMANPVLEQVLTNLFDVELDLQQLISRILFWMGMAFVLWPLLVVGAERLQRPFGPIKARRVFGFGLNATSVSNALWMFNGLLLMQLVMDGGFAISGELPYGMSYARYAHRGAYPLVATALLAGCFALAARPFLDEGRWLKPLMIVWLGLNALLTVSSMYRLGIYVEAYGLTYLRIRAGIWMVLVALWLGLIAWQILKTKANGWLVFRSFAMGVGTLYVGCFVNFAEVIAQYNSTHHRYHADSTYSFCPLIGTSTTANRVMQGREGCSYYHNGPKIDGWRDWGFREWRIARYVEPARTERSNHENSGR
jgi:hypothetical protein